MTLGSNNFLCGQNSVTDGAVLALCQTGLGTGGFHSCVDHFGVTLGSNNFLCGQNGITDGAVLAFCQTGLGTGSFHSCVDHLGVTLGSNNFLCGQNGITDGAVLALCQTGLGAGSFHSCVDHFGVTLGSNNFLCGQNGITDGAVLTFCQTGLGAGCFHSCVDHLGVTLGFDLVTLFGVTTGLTGIGGVAASCAIGGSHHFVIIMTGGCDLVTVFGMTAGLTGEGCVAGFRTSGSSHSFVIVMAGCSNDIVIFAVAAGLAGIGSITCVCTGRSSHGSFIIMAGSLGLICLVAVAAACAGVSGIAFLHAGGIRHHSTVAMAGSCHRRICVAVAADSTGVGGEAFIHAGGLCHLGAVAVTDCFNDLSIRVAADGFFTGIGLDTFGGTAGLGGDDTVVILMGTFSVPCAVGIGKDALGGCAGAHIGAVSILHLHRNQRDLHISRLRGITSLNHLIGHCLGTGTDLCHTVAITDNFSTAGSTVGIALRSIDDTIDYDLGVHQIGIGAIIHSAGCIDNRNERLVDSTCVAAPLISVIDINIDIGTQNTIRTLSNVDHRAGQQCHVLIDLDCAAANIHCQITIDGQFVLAGVDIRTTHIQRNGINGHLAMRFHHQSVCGAVITLDHITRSQIEHGVAGTDKCHGRTEVCLGHIDRGVAVFLRAGVQGQGDFDVLHIVLTQGENTVFHIRALCAAAEVCDLEQLIDDCTGIGCHSTGTCDKAVGVKCTAVVDGNVTAIFHADEADSPTGSRTKGLGTLRIVVLTRKAHRTVDGQIGTFCHGQSTIRRRYGIRIGSGLLHTGNLCGIEGIGIIKGDEQSDAGGDGIVTCRQGGIVHQNERFAGGACGCSCGCGKTLKQIAAGNSVVIQLAQAKETGTCGLLCRRAQQEPGRGIFAYKGCLDGHIFRRGQSEAGITGKHHAVCSVDPAEESAAVGSSCSQRGAIGQADLLHRTGFYNSAVNGDAAVSAVKFHRHIGCLSGGDQSKFTQSQRCSTCAQAALGLQDQSYRCTGVQNRAVAAAGGGFTCHSEAAIAGCGVGKGQGCHIFRLVCNGHRIGLLAEQAACSLDSHGVAGNGTVAKAVCHRNLTVQNGNGGSQHADRIIGSSLSLQSIGESEEQLALTLQKRKFLFRQLLDALGSFQFGDLPTGCLVGLPIHFVYHGLHFLFGNVGRTEIGLEKRDEVFLSLLHGRRIHIELFQHFFVCEFFFLIYDLFFRFFHHFGLFRNGLFVGDLFLIHFLYGSCGLFRGKHLHRRHGEHHDQHQQEREQSLCHDLSS